MARKPADQTVSREDVIRAAARVFRERGFHGTSMQQIADAVGLQKGSLYHHITSKEELLHDVMMTGLTQLSERLEAVATSPLPPDEKLRQLIETHIYYAAESLDIATVVLFEHRAMMGFPALREEYVARRDLFESQFRTAIQEGVDSGDFCLMRHKVVQEMNRLPEVMRFPRGLRSWIGFNQTGYEYDRSKRQAGKSKYNFKELYNPRSCARVGFVNTEEAMRGYGLRSNYQARSTIGSTR